MDIQKQMQEKRAAALEEARAALWAGNSEKAIEIALGAGLTENQVGKLQSEVDEARAIMLAGNAVDLQAIQTEIQAAEKCEQVAESALEKADTEYRNASSRARSARSALEAAKLAVNRSAAYFADGHAPKGVEPSKDVQAVMLADHHEQVRAAKEQELKVKVRKLSEQINNVQGRLSGASTALSREGSFSKDVQTLEGQLKKLVDEKASVLKELETLK